MYLDEAYLNNLRGNDLILPSKAEFTKLHVYLRGQVVGLITENNVEAEANRLNENLATKGITVGIRGLSTNFSKIRGDLVALGLTVEKDFDLNAYKKASEAYGAIIGERIDAFRNELYDYYGVTDNPKADAVYDKAYDMGHAAGFGEVSAHFGDLVDLIVD